MKKQILGQYFTKNNIWLLNHIIKYIKNKKVTKELDVLYDPFAGDGDLLSVNNLFKFDKVKGLDIDDTLKWEINDSLKNIPIIKNGFIITNPPYLGKSSAKRKKIYNNVSLYFEENNDCDDLYKIAIKKIFNTNLDGVMIVPETFINSSLLKEKYIFDKIYSITILENNPFNDTETPICIVCFHGDKHKNNDILIYKNESFLGKYSTLDVVRTKLNENINIIPNIKFNSKKGQIGLIAFDGTTKEKIIEFKKVEELKYNIKNIKISSRAVSIIEIEEKYNKYIGEIISKANLILNKYRKETQDIFLSPFKGNDKKGKRRRRLDFKTARAILAKAISEIKIF